MRPLLILSTMLLPALVLAGEATPDSVPAPHTFLNANAPQHININHVPRFALLGKEGKYYIGIGADIEVAAVYDLGSPVGDPNSFLTSAIPLSNPPGNGARFKLTAQQSDIYVNVVALPGTSQQIGAYVAFNFLGNNYTPSLEHAYLKYRDLTAGYTYTIFGDIAAAPATIDYEGPNALPTIQHCMISYERFLDRSHSWRAGIALDVPEYSSTNALHTAEVSQRIPDIPVYLQRFWNGGDSWLRLSAILRNLYYRNTLSARNVDKLGGGLNLSGKSPLAGALTGSFSALWGKGICSYIQDLNGLGMDLLPSSPDGSSLKAVEAWGITASLSYQFTPAIFSGLSYSQVRTYARNLPAADIPQYRYAQYVAANTFYNVNSIVQIGLEYIYGRRVDYGSRQAHDSRLEAMLKVSF